MATPVLQHSGLDDAQLGPRLARLLAPGSPLPAREMVARGLAPLAGAEPWLALYHLWVVGGATLAEHASRTAADLPESAVVSALVDPHLPAVVLDFMARRRLRSPDALRLLVHHPRIADPTLQTVARAAPTPVCEVLAHNQRRWLGCPAIAVQLIRNPHCDRATVHAMLELGAREGVAALAALRREALAGSVLQDSHADAARLTAWLLRGAAVDPPPDVPTPPAIVLPARPGGARDPDLRPEAPQPADDLSSRPAAEPPGPARASGPPPPILGARPHGPAPPLRPNAPPVLGARPPSNLSPGPVPRPPPVPATRGAASRITNLSSGPAATPPARVDPSPGPADPATNLSPGTGDSATNLSPGPAAPARPRVRLDLTPPREDDADNDELDLPIAEGWDEALGPGLRDIPPPAPRSAVPWPETDVPLPPPPPRKPEQRSLFSDALGGAPTPAPIPAPARQPAISYADRVARVLDRRTPLTVAMSLLYQLRARDLRRVAAARHLDAALVSAARRRVVRSEVPR